jgi:tetratricopeptide (TPR) repeat protein
MHVLLVCTFADATFFRMRFLCTWAGLLLLSPAAVPAQEGGGVGAGNDPLTFVNKGVEDNAKGDYAGAMDAFNHALELNAQDPAAFEGRGETHLAQGELSDAANDFTKALAIEPQDETSLFERAVAETKTGDFASALQDENQALRTGALPPRAAVEIYLQRGRTKICQGDYAGAMADANDALKLKANSTGAFFLRGVAENANGQSAAAADDFSKAAEGGMPEAALWFWLAKTDAHESDAASVQLPILLAKAQRGHADAWLQELGNLLQQKTTSEQVIADLPTAGKNEMKAEQGWFFLGVSREFSSDVAGAKDAYGHVNTIGASDSFLVVESRRRLKLLTS